MCPLSPVVVKALTMLRLFLKEQVMLNFRDAEEEGIEEKEEIVSAR